MARSSTWLVSIWLPPGDVDALRHAASKVLDPFDYTFITDEETDTTDLSLRSRESDHARAIQWADARYQQIRIEAGLSATDEVRLLGSVLYDRGAEATFLQSPNDFRLLAEAKRLLTDSQFEWSVVAGQAACEVRLAHAIAAMLGHAPTSLAQHIIKTTQPTNLANDRVRKLFVALSGRDPAREPWWSAYKAHAERRHKIVHGGAQVDRKSAEDSLAASQAAFEFITDAWAAVVG